MLDIRVLERPRLVMSVESRKGWDKWEWVVQEHLLQRNLSKQAVLDQLL
jgi:hypothetical protein